MSNPEERRRLIVENISLADLTASPYIYAAMQRAQTVNLEGQVSVVRWLEGRYDEWMVEGSIPNFDIYRRNVVVDAIKERVVRITIYCSRGVFID